MRRDFGYPAPRRPVLWLSLSAGALALATLITPIFVMRPFRPQGPTELALALAVLRLAPLLFAAAGALMVVRTAAEVRAYPVRVMAYHHVLNDAPGGVPVVVTY